MDSQYKSPREELQDGIQHVYNLLMGRRAHRDTAAIVELIAQMDVAEMRSIHAPSMQFVVLDMTVGGERKV